MGLSPIRHDASPMIGPFSPIKASKDFRSSANDRLDEASSLLQTMPLLSPTGLSGSSRNFAATSAHGTSSSKNGTETTDPTFRMLPVRHSSDHSNFTTTTTTTTMGPSLHHSSLRDSPPWKPNNSTGTRRAADAINNAAEKFNRQLHAQRISAAHAARAATDAANAAFRASVSYHVQRAST